MFRSRLYVHVDWLLLGAIFLLGVIGVTMIYSATYDPTTQTPGIQFHTQIYTLLLGLLALFLCLLVDYRTFADYCLLIYIGIILILGYVLVFGIEAGGASRWVSFGQVSLQPSEFAKVGLTLVIATFFAAKRHGAASVGNLLKSGVIVALPVFLIAIEPDLGTAVTLLVSYVGVIYFSGLRMRVVAVLTLVAILVAPVVWTYALQDYQRSRISTFLDPERDAQGAGYQQIQARITVGSGGLTGKGFLGGTQGQYKFLPVAHNDFIFSVLAEEQGFLGVLVALGLYLFVILRGFETARLATDRLGTCLVVGIMSAFSFQVIYNITMSAGLVPVKGLPLPLMSYGGSSAIATLMGFGFILNVRMRRFMN